MTARGVQNHNPLNIEDGAFARKQPGYVGHDKRFAKFHTMEQGIEAAAALLLRYHGKGIKTVAGVIGKWAPAGSENPHNKSYIASVCRDLGVKPHDAIDLCDHTLRVKLAKAMAFFETGTRMARKAR